jgi:hypothetical protein
MKVLDLACSLGLVQCPICDDATITKKLSAPRINLGVSGPTEVPLVSEHGKVAPDSIAPNIDTIRAQDQKGVKDEANMHPLHALMRNPEFQAAYMQMAKEVLAKTEDVGKDFAREARKIHYGESKERGIRGQASQDETFELLDEGIEVMPLLLPKALKGPLQ